MKMQYAWIGGALGLLLPTQALGAEPTAAQCVAASTRAAELEGKSKFRDALKERLSCAASSCPAEIQSECQRQAEEDGNATTSIVFAVRDGDGNDLRGARITIDGALVTDSVEGTAIVLDPGPHDFTFEVVGRPSVKKALTLVQGEKARREIIVMGLPTPTPAATGGATPREERDHPVGGDAAMATRGSNALVPAGWILGGVGLVGVGVGAAFGLDAMSKDNRAGCDADSVCADPQARRDAQTSATISTVGIIGGGVLLAAGVGLILFAPRAQATGTSPGFRAAAVGVRASVVREGGGLSMGGSF